MKCVLDEHRVEWVHRIQCVSPALGTTWELGFLGLFTFFFFRSKVPLYQTIFNHLYFHEQLGVINDHFMHISKPNALSPGWVLFLFRNNRKSTMNITKCSWGTYFIQFINVKHYTYIELILLLFSCRF